MSKPSDRGASSSSSNNRVTPTFFGSPSLYQQIPEEGEGRGVKKDLGIGFPPQAENPYWNDINHPPPPYSPAPNEPISPQSSSISADPSAPPLEVDPSAPTTAGIYPQPQQHQRQQPPLQQQYPPQGYHNYGAVPYPRQPNNTSDAGVPNWPWIAPPSATGQPLLVYQPTQRQPPPPGEYENYSAPPQNNKKKRNCCEISVQYFFYFFCVCLVIRLIDLLSGGVSLGGSCTHGVVWEDLPKQFEYDAGLKVSVVGGHITGGHIVIKSIEESTSEEDGAIVKGIIKPTVMISPASLGRSADISYSETHIMNGTVLEINVPKNLPIGACVSLNAVIYVPKNSGFLFLELQNSRIEVTDHRLDIEKVLLQTTNQAIEYNPVWQGEDLYLITTNALIDLKQPINNSRSVLLTTSNAPIRARSYIKAQKIISMTTSNGAIDVDDTLESNQVVNLESANAHINAHNIKAYASHVKTSNGRIQIYHSSVSGVFNVQTSNAKLNLALNEGPHTEVVASTLNGGIETQFPRDFEGTFEVTTSSYNKVKLVDRLDWTHLSSIGNGHVYGNRFRPGHGPDRSQPMGKITLKTANSNIAVQFGSSLEIL